MSKNLQGQPTTTTQPTNFFVNLAGSVKQLTWAGFKALMDALYVPLTRTVNGHALSGDVTVSKTDVGLGNVTDDAQLKAADLDTDGTLAANSDSKVPSQKAVKTYADAAAAAAAAALVDSAPGALNTLKELADAINDDASYAATMTTALAGKQAASTLGADSAAAVHAATSKGTPVDADELMLIDSAASNGLKKLTWANLKATAKTYFDTLYAAIAHAASHKSGGTDAIKLDELAAPTDVTTLDATTSAHGLLPKLGGGTTNFLRADGTWAAPSGGGGAALVRGKGTLTGYDSAGAPATQAWGNINCMGYYVSATGRITITLGGTPFVINVDTSDAADGSYWIDSSTLTAGANLADAIATALSSQSFSYTNVLSSEGTVTFNSVATGSASTLAIDASGVSGLTSGTTDGTDAGSPTGGTQTIDLIAADGSKTLKPVRIWLYSEDQSQSSFSEVKIVIYLKVGETTYEVSHVTADQFGGAEFPTFDLAQNVAQEWYAGRASAKLTAEFVSTGGALPTGGQVTVYAIAEQN